MRSNTFGACRPRYELLDGLRGVAAILVIWYHFFEAFATSSVDQMMNHGYLAVDFFFVLSGFVIGYAYDGRWNGGLTSGGFMLRRFVRLHPMVALSVVLGAVAYIMQGCVKWDGTQVPLSMVALALLMGLLLLPAWPGFAGEVRGNGEMFPLNGPSWSLFIEYVGSFLYAMWIHRLSTGRLALLTFAAGVGLAFWSVCDMSGAYHLGVGWSVMELGLFGGFLRLIYSFSAGLLIQRIFVRRAVSGAFWLCSAVIVLVLSMPYAGGGAPSVWNGIYDALCAILIFPAVVYLGACGTTTDALSWRICEFLGRLSYPVYIIHYPVMYLYYDWVWRNRLSFSQVWWVCVLLFAGIVVMSWLAMRFYDEPVRKWLGRKLLRQ